MTKLYRSHHDCKITGLCGGIAQRIGMDPTVVRLIAVGSIFVTSGASIFVYLIAAMVVPREPWTGGPGPDYQPGGPSWSESNQYGHWKDWKRAEKHYRKAQQYGWTPPYERQAPPSGPSSYEEPPISSSIDDMMDDLERKAMLKEIEQLRSKVAEYEKKEKSTQINANDKNNNL